MIKLPIFQDSVFIGILLSNGWLWTIKRLDYKTTICILTTQSYSHFEYIWFVFYSSNFSHYCNPSFV